MDAFDENAFFLLVWRAILVALVGAVLLLTHPIELSVALLAAGNIALVFSVVLIACAASLTEDRIVRSEAWRLLPPAERPVRRRGSALGLQSPEEIYAAVCQGRVCRRDNIVGIGADGCGRLTLPRRPSTKTAFLPPFDGLQVECAAASSSSDKTHHLPHPRSHSDRLCT